MTTDGTPSNRYRPDEPASDSSWFPDGFLWIDAAFWFILGVLLTVFVMALLPDIPMELYELRPAAPPEGIHPL